MHPDPLRPSETSRPIRIPGGCRRAGRSLADELSMRPLVAHCHMGLGKLFRRTGDRAKADEHLATATAMYREMDMGFWLEKAEAEVARS